MNYFFKCIHAAKQEQKKFFGLHPDWINGGMYLLVLVLAIVINRDVLYGLKVGVLLDGIFLAIGTMMEYALGRKLLEGKNR